MVVELWIELLLLQRLVELILFLLRVVVHAHFLLFLYQYHLLLGLVCVCLHYLVVDSALLELGKSCVSGVVGSVTYAVHRLWRLVLHVLGCS